MKRYIIASWLVPCVLLLSAPDALSQVYPVQSLLEQYAPTPKAQAQIEYGNVSADPVSGSVSLEIPVGSYSDQDFTIPVSLVYHYTGFKPSSPSGEAGLGWSLNAGGSVTREIVGVDDFGDGGYYGCSSYNASQVYGMDSTQVHITYIDGVGPSLGGQRETTSDLYHFSFPGHSGSFVIDNAGHFTPYGTSGEGGTYAISYSDGTFTIRTSDGLTWRFGSSGTSREQMLRQNGILETDPHQLSELAGELPTVTWLLDRITAPDGRRADFSYASSRSNMSIPVGSGIVDDVITTYGRGHNDDNQHYYYKFASLVYTSYLTGITVTEQSGTPSKTVATLNWERKSYREIDESGTAPFAYTKMIVPTRRLTGVTLSDGGTQLRTASLSYNDSKGRPLLTSVNVPVYGTWTFQYNLPSSGNFPGQLSNAVDFWGYYNGKDSNSDNLIAPTTLFGLTYYDEVLNTDKMDPDAGYSVLGSLKKVTWPTGGTTSIAYEGHTAWQMLLRRRIISYDPIPEPDRSFLTGYLPSRKLVSTMLHNNQCGGIRVQSITEDSVTDGTATRSYDYTDADGHPSGIIYEFNRYYAGKFGQTDMFNPYLRFPGNGFNPTHIAYKRVTETLPDGTKVQTDYSSWEDSPDEFSPHRIWYDVPPISQDPEYLRFIYNILREGDSRAYRRGLPLKKTLLAAAGDTLRVETYAYTDTGSDYAAYVVGSGNWWWSARRFLCDRVVSSVTTTDYPSAGSPLSSTVAYTYDTYGRKLTEQTTDSDGSVRRTEYTYLGGTLQPSLVSTVAQKSRPAGSTLTYTAESSSYGYTQSGNLWNLTSETRTLYGATTTGTGSGTVADQVSYSAYDSHGHPREITVNGEPTAVVWGYRSRYPVATVRGSTFLSLPASVRNHSGDALSAAQVKSLYELVGKEVHVYSWTPSVGLQREIGPSGRSLHYEYDSLKRLSAIRDASDSLVTGYSYGSAPFSQGISLRFTESSTPTGAGTRSERAVYDGLGRAWMQSTLPDGSQNPLSLISLVRHDGLGRLTETLLPYAASAGSGSLSDAYTFQRFYWNGLYGLQEGQYARTATTYAGGPLALPVKALLPGKAHADADKATTFARSTNASGEVPFLYYNDADKTVSVNGFHAAGTLLRTETVSPDGERSVSFTTALGLPVLTRSVSGTEHHDTFFVRDRMGRSVLVVTPALGDAVAVAAAAGTPTLLTSSQTASSCYAYGYDDKGNPVRTQRPGAGEDSCLYDNAHRVVTERPSTTLQTSNRLYTKSLYDGIGREVARVLYRASFIPDDPIRGTSPEGRVVPEDTLLDTLVTRTYGQSTSVDCITTDTPGTPYADIPLELHFASRSGIVSAADLHVTGEVIMESQYPLLTAVLPFGRTEGVLGWSVGDGMVGDTPARTAYYYDGRGRVVQSVRSWPDGGLTRISRSYDPEGRVLEELEEHKQLLGLTDWLWTQRSYDTRGHLLTEAVWAGRGLQPLKTAASVSDTTVFSYDGIGRLTGKTLSCSGHTLSADVGTTMQGWTDSLSYRLSGSPVFRESLRYWNPVHQGVTPRYGGTAAEIVSVHGGGAQRRESYSYDGFGRLAGTSSYASDSGPAGAVNVEDGITYDRMGNILTLTRRDASGSPSAQLSMTYDGMRLSGGTDAAASSQWTYDYNADGSVSRDRRTNRSYADNWLGLLAEEAAGADVFHRRADVTYVYLPDGTKTEARRLNYPSALYRGSFVYRKSPSGTVSLETVLLPGGMVTVTDTTWTPYAWVQDRLGNVRGVVDMAAGTVVERSDYYAFGSRIASDPSAPGAYPSIQANRWRYAGKEEQAAVTGLSLDDFGARMYDPFIARWMAVDPLSEKYPGLSPYVYCADDPVNYVDPKGLVFTPGSLVYLSAYEQEVNRKYDQANVRHRRLENRMIRRQAAGKSTDRIQRRMGRQEEIMEEMKNVRSELKTLKESIQVYDISQSTNKDAVVLFGKTKYDIDNSVVRIVLHVDGMHDQYMATIAHELKHAFQFEDGRLGFSIIEGEGSPCLFDINDEIEAHERGKWFSGMPFDKSFYNNLSSENRYLPLNQSESYYQQYAEKYSSIIRVNGVTYVPVN